MIIGKVGAVHGIHGELRIIPLTDFIERFETMTEVMVGDDMREIMNVEVLVEDDKIISIRG